MAKNDLVAAPSGVQTKKMRCQCDSEYQDKKYGLGIRVFNKGTTKYTCTVCKAQRA